APSPLALLRAEANPPAAVSVVRAEHSLAAMKAKTAVRVGRVHPRVGVDVRLVCLSTEAVRVASDARDREVSPDRAHAGPQRQSQAVACRPADQLVIDRCVEVPDDLASGPVDLADTLAEVRRGIGGDPDLQLPPLPRTHSAPRLVS